MDEGSDRRAVAGITSGSLRRAVDKGDRIVGDGMTAQSVFECVEKYGRRIGIEIAPPTTSAAPSPNSGHNTFRNRIVQSDQVFIRVSRGPSTTYLN
jgi:hypothetical protein